MAHNVKLNDLSMPDLQQLIVDAQKALSEKVSAERSELIKKLEALDAIAKPIRAAAAPTRQRAAPAPLYRAPNGAEWSGRGGIPRVFKQLGVETKEDMEAYRIRV